MFIKTEENRVLQISFGCSIFGAQASAKEKQLIRRLACLYLEFYQYCNILYFKNNWPGIYACADIFYIVFHKLMSVFPSPINHDRYNRPDIILM